ncbi:YfcE family phosphodiesterase [Clostridium sp. AM58-1XD]|uniref:metallophosphoesterase family protein n=1 Tax=Clostridium sp. AM58-1XD TaxID=2292307 RepID=UPI000E4ACD00|nr:YfcE family phosphodiesterase [Clostridium sp. AM58-1XD]RGY98552.1 YfcE family phosphodiesterase [Clostridium sp. AM58-1XD]
MRILIVSDTHRRDENLKNLLAKMCPIDMLIHLGDAEGSEDKIAKWVNPECRLEMVLGNNDFFSSLDREKEISIGRYKALLTHGHYYGVSLGPEGIMSEGRARGMDIVMFGHTHQPYLHHYNGLTVLNPGSLSYPRQDGRKPSYIMMEIDGDGEAHYAVNFLERK